MKFIINILFCFSSLFIIAQKIEVSGLVVDKADNFPIPGVNIFNNHGDKLIATNFDGKYSLEINKNDTLIFSLEGYETKRVKVVSNELNISLKQDHNYERNFYYNKKNIIIGTKISADQIVNNGKPKAFFQKNKEKNLFIIFVTELNSSTKSPKDSIYEQRFNVQYYSKSFGWDDKFVAKYNKLTYRYLEKKYNKSWLNGIRMDAVEIEKYLE